MAQEDLNFTPNSVAQVNKKRVILTLESLEKSPPKLDPLELEKDNKDLVMSSNKPQLYAYNIGVFVLNLQSIMMVMYVHCSF